MARLANRNTDIPNGLQFYLPATGWRPRPHSSFQGITEGLLRHLQGNPAVAAKLGWELDYNFLAEKVDEFNAQICVTNGWKDYLAVDGGQPRRPFRGRLFEAVRSVPAPRSRCCGSR